MTAMRQPNLPENFSKAAGEYQRKKNDAYAMDRESTISRTPGMSGLDYDFQMHQGRQAGQAAQRRMHDPNQRKAYSDRDRFMADPMRGAEKNHREIMGNLDELVGDADRRSLNEEYAGRRRRDEFEDAYRTEREKKSNARMNTRLHGSSSRPQAGKISTLA